MNPRRFFSISSRRLLVSLMLAALLAPAGCSSTGGDGDGPSSSHFISNLEPGRPITAHAAGRDPVTINQPRSGSAGQPGGTSSRAEPRLRPVDPATTGGNSAGNPSRSSFAEDEAAILDAMGEDDLGGGGLQESDAYQGDDVWSILLRSVATENHERDAQEIAQIFARACPELRGMWIHTSEIGSKVLFGRFTSVDDPATQEALKWVKEQREIKNGAQPFHAAMLVRIEGSSPGSAGGRVHPYDLRSLRRAYPRVDPLYTMQVAAWVGPEDNDTAWVECKRQAEQYAASLRAQNHEAWFHHDDTARISSVTVGKFDRRIINQTSGLYTLDVERMYDKFPVHLLNGEEVLVHEDANDPNSPIIPQQPRLVEVPKDLE